MADTSVGQYRRKDGKVSFRLRTYLMIGTEGTFRLGAYLRDISGSLTLSSGEKIPLSELAFSEHSLYRFGVMMHDFWAGGVAPREVIEDDVAMLRVDYHISFTGHRYEEPEFFEMRVPLLARGTAEERFGRKWRSA